MQLGKPRMKDSFQAFLAPCIDFEGGESEEKKGPGEWVQEK